MIPITLLRLKFRTLRAWMTYLWWLWRWITLKRKQMLLGMRERKCVPDWTINSLDWRWRTVRICWMLWTGIFTKWYKITIIQTNNKNRSKIIMIPNMCSITRPHSPMSSPPRNKENLSRHFSIRPSNFVTVDKTKSINSKTKSINPFIMWRGSLTTSTDTSNRKNKPNGTPPSSTLYILPLRKIQPISLKVLPSHHHS